MCNQAQQNNEPRKGSLDEDLAKQLHEQHAQNENNRNSQIIAFLTGIVFAVGGYGYTFIELEQDTIGTSETILTIIASACIACIVLTIISAFNISIGYVTRRDCMMINCLRAKYSNLNKFTGFKSTNKIGFTDFLLEINKVIFYSCQAVMISIIISLGFFLACVVPGFQSCCAAVVSILMFIAFESVNIWILISYKNKYLKQSKKYSAILNDINQEIIDKEQSRKS